jgi:uncharacterized protein involved in exopolysaccharide biosynthesis
MGNAPSLSVVLLICCVTTASAVWASSGERPVYSATLVLQVNDTQAQSDGPATSQSMSLFVDPIQSEMQILTSASIQERVAESLGMRLARVPVEEPRSLIMHNVWLSPGTPDFQSYRLVYNAQGTHAQLLADDGALMAEAPAGHLLDAGFVRFVVMGVPAKLPLLFELQTLPARAAAGSIVFSAVTRPETNMVDVRLNHYDAVLAPEILNAAAIALREHGANRVGTSARSREQFIQAQLEASARTLGESRAAVLSARRTESATRESELLRLEAWTHIDLESYQFILSQLYQAQITGGTDPAYVEIVDPASGATGIHVRGAVNLVLAALLGLVLGLGAVFSLPLLNRAAVQADRRWLEKPF